MKKNLLFTNFLKFFLIFFLFSSNICYSENDIFIAVKVDNEIITNIDIQKESNYLIALNNNLSNVEKETLHKIAKDSIIREKIKKIELTKYMELGQESDYLNQVLVNFYTKLNIKNDEEFKTYISKYNLSLNEIKRKLEIETAWNEIIFEKYRKQITINEEKLKKELQEKINNAENVTSYFLSEIVFNANNKEDFDKKLNEIKSSILENGFNNTANLYSISDSSKFQGDIGWLNENQLSDITVESLKNIKLNEYTKPINISGTGFLILYLKEKKEEKLKINFEDEFSKLISAEKNRQFNQFSSIYFNKIKFNTVINEK